MVQIPLITAESRKDLSKPGTEYKRPGQSLYTYTRDESWSGPGNSGSEHVVLTLTLPLPPLPVRRFWLLSDRIFHHSELNLSTPLCKKRKQNLGSAQNTLGGQMIHFQENQKDSSDGKSSLSLDERSAATVSDNQHCSSASLNWQYLTELGNLKTSLFLFHSLWWFYKLTDNAGITDTLLNLISGTFTGTVYCALPIFCAHVFPSVRVFFQFKHKCLHNQVIRVRMLSWLWKKHVK